MTSVAIVQFSQNKHWVKTNRSPLDLLNTVVGLIFPQGDDNPYLINLTFWSSFEMSVKSSQRVTLLTPLWELGSPLLVVFAEDEDRRLLSRVCSSREWGKEHCMLSRMLLRPSPSQLPSPSVSLSSDRRHISHWWHCQVLEEAELEISRI